MDITRFFVFEEWEKNEKVFFKKRKIGQSCLLSENDNSKTSLPMFLDCIIYSVYDHTVLRTVLKTLLQLSCTKLIVCIYNIVSTYI